MPCGPANHCFKHCKHHFFGKCSRCNEERKAVKPLSTFKLDLSHVPGFFIRALAAPFVIGAAKYNRGDWKSMVKTAEQAKEAIDRRKSSLLNHLTKVLDGENYDEDGFHHFAAVAWNALYILYLQCTYLGYKPYLEDVLAERVEFHQNNKLKGG